MNTLRKNKQSNFDFLRISIKLTNNLCVSFDQIIVTLFPFYHHFGYLAISIFLYDNFFLRLV